MGGRRGKAFLPLYAAIRDDIFAFCKALNFTPTWQQAQVLEAVNCGRARGGAFRCRRCQQTGFSGPHKRIAVRSGQGPGKTSITTIITLWWILRWENAQAVVTAPTMRQARDIWVATARKNLSKAEPLLQKLIDVTNSRVIIAGKRDWGVELITATKPENALGKHNDHLMFIIEEASGIARDIFETIEGTLTNEDSLLIAIGNPTLREGSFFDCFHRDKTRWLCFALNAEESPIVAKDHIAHIEDKYGRNSDFFRVRVLGEFPLSNPNCIMSLEDLEACTKNKLYDFALKPRWLDQPDVSGPAKQFGLDFARYGSDENVIVHRLGEAMVGLIAREKQDPNVTVNDAFQRQKEFGWKDSETYYVPDANGIGQGVMHRFADADKLYEEFFAQGTPNNTDEFDNKITEAWFTFARKVKRQACHLKDDQRMIVQLANRHYHMTKAGKLVVESKDDYQKRGVDEGQSPDRADGCVMGFYDDLFASGRITNGSPQGVEAWIK